MAWGLLGTHRSGESSLFTIPSPFCPGQGWVFRYAPQPRAISRDSEFVSLRGVRGCVGASFVRFPGHWARTKNFSLLGSSASFSSQSFTGLSCWLDASQWLSFRAGCQWIPKVLSRLNCWGSSCSVKFPD